MNWKGEGSQRAISVVLLALSLFYLLSSFKYKVGTYKIVGPGFLPLVIGILLVVSTGLHLVRVFRAKPGERKPRESAGETADTGIEHESMEGKESAETAAEGGNYLAIGGILACTAAYPLIIEYLKFVLSTFMVGFAMFILLKPRSIVLSFILSAAMALSCFLIFSRLFGVALPSGPLEVFLYRIGS
jgi:cytochrome c oxidase subunit IV